MLENLFEYCIATESSKERQKQLGTNIEFPNYIKKYMREMGYYCGDDFNPFCRDRVHGYLDFDSNEKILWDQAAKCVNSTFVSYDSTHVDYFKDENYVLK